MHACLLALHLAHCCVHVLRENGFLLQQIRKVTRKKEEKSRFFTRRGCCQPQGATMAQWTRMSQGDAIDEVLFAIYRFDCRKGWSLVDVLLPRVAHDVIQRARTPCWCIHAIAREHLVDHLEVAVIV